MSLKGLYSSEDCDWRTPRALFDRLDAEFHFACDLAADADSALPPGRKSYFGPGSLLHQDALAIKWTFLCLKGPGFLNPPYSRRRGLSIAPWMVRCLEVQQEGGAVVAIVPARTDTPWWHDYVMQAREIRLVRGRIHFDPSPARLAAHPTKRSSGNFPSAVVIWDGRGSQTARGPRLCSWDWK